MGQLVEEPSGEPRSEPNREGVGIPEELLARQAQAKQHARAEVENQECATNTSITCRN